MYAHDLRCLDVESDFAREDETLPHFRAMRAEYKIRKFRKVAPRRRVRTLRRKVSR